MQTQAFAYVIFKVGFIGYICIALLFQLAEQKIKTYLLKQDSKVFGKIVPSRKARLLLSLPFIFFVMIVTGVLIGIRNSSLWVVLTIGIGAFIIFFLMQRPIFLKLNGNFIHVQHLGKERTYQISDILSISFRPCRGFIPKSLVIVFTDRKSYWFDMDKYCGVQNVYNELIKRIEQHKSNTKGA